MKRCLITGGSGFVSANLARYLLQRGDEVHLLMRPGYNRWRIADIHSQVQIHCVMMTDAENTAAVVGAVRPDWVFHLATYGASSWQTNSIQIAQTNFMGTLNLVNACLKTGFEAFINTGSSSEYGFKSFAPPEDTWLEPNSDYAVTKAAATLYCRSIAQRHNVHMPTLRLYSVYGPYEEPKRLIPSLIVHGLRADFPPLVNADIARDYIYIDDVVDAYMKAAIIRKPEWGAIYNVGSGIQTRIRDIVESVRHLLHIESTPQYGSMPERKWDTSIWIANNAKIRTELGWQPQRELMDGLGATIAWMQDHPDLHQFYSGEILSQ